MSWNWVQRDVVFAVHDKQLAIHGGLAGIRDLTAVESAINQAQNLGNPLPDVAAPAAAYIHGIATSQGFNDGRKRTAWVIGRMFLAINGETLVVKDVDAINFMRTVAAGTITEPQVADWLRQHIYPESVDTKASFYLCDRPTLSGDVVVAVRPGAKRFPVQGS